MYELPIRQAFSTLPHPQAEGLAGDAEDTDGLSAADVGLTAGELVDNSGRCFVRPHTG